MLVLACSWTAASACSLASRGTGVEQLVADASVPSGDEPPPAGLDKPTTCQTPRASCGTDGCVDVTSDPRHCGSCDKACAVGEGCVASACTILCAGGTTACGGACVNVQTDPNHCGRCGNACAPGFVCASGACQSTCPSGLFRCTRPSADGGVVESCADLTNDDANCGACGKKCAINETCTASACKPLCAPGSIPGDVYPTMIGCTGTVAFGNRASLCPPNVPVCTAAQYRQRRGTKAPTYNYWTNDDLRGTGYDGNCAVAPAGTFGYGSCSSTTPMRVCAAHTDPLGNECNGIRCGWQSTQNEWFGGCTGNTTAGSLCCAP